MTPVLHSPAAHTLVECLTELKFGRPVREQMILTELINYTVRRLGNDGPGFDPNTVFEVFEKGDSISPAPLMDVAPSKENCQSKSIELTNKFPEVIGQHREELCAAFSEAIEWGRNN